MIKMENRTMTDQASTATPLSPDQQRRLEALHDEDAKLELFQAAQEAAMRVISDAVPDDIEFAVDGLWARFVEWIAAH
jgi:hypothetical protein